MSAGLTVYECPECGLHSLRGGYCLLHPHPTIPAPELVPVPVVRAVLDEETVEKAARAIAEHNGEAEAFAVYGRHEARTIYRGEAREALRAVGFVRAAGFGSVGSGVAEQAGPEGGAR